MIFDLGGVVLGSPFVGIRAYEQELGLAPGDLRVVFRAHGEEGAWQRHERGELSYEGFCREFAAEGRAAGVEFDPAALLHRIDAEVGPRPVMVAAVRAVRAAGIAVAALTNNWAQPAPAAARFDRLRREFDVFVESHVVGMRKPDPRIYRHTLDLLGVAPAEAVFLDDIGRNLKPAQELGIVTIKVETPAAALAELGELLGLSLVGG